MNSRQRVRAVLNREIPDRVPFGLGGAETTGLHLLAYSKLNEILGLDIMPRLDTFMANAVFEKETIHKMQGDMILLASPHMCTSPLWGKGYEAQWKQQQLWGKTFRVPIADKFVKDENGALLWNDWLICPEGSLYFDGPGTTDFYADIEVPDPSTFNPSHEIDEKTLRALEDTAKELYEETDLSISCGETITDLQVQPCGFIGTLILTKEEPEIMHEYLTKCTDAGIAQLKQLDQAIGKYTDMLLIAHDLGDNRAVTMGADPWREIYKPHYKRLLGEWKRISNMKVSMHSCGAISDVLPDLIECGVDVYNPVQTSAEGMSAASLKERFGKDIIFYGGAYDTQSILPDTSYDAVYDTVKDNIKTLMQGGGYIAAGVHNLPGDLPKEHLRAILDAFYAVREY